MISNIVVACLRQDVKEKSAKCLADNLDMIYADIDELVKFSVINPQDVIEKVGLEYLQQLTDKEVLNVSTYENSVITASDEIITNSKSILTLKSSSLIIFIKIPYKKYKKYIIKQSKGILQPKDIIDLNMFFDKEKIISKSANIIIHARWMNYKRITKKILKAIKKYYSK